MHSPIARNIILFVCFSCHDCLLEEQFMGHSLLTLQVDVVIDRCSHMQNLRECVWGMRLRAERALSRAQR